MTPCIILIVFAAFLCITFEDILIDKEAEYLKLARSFGEDWKNYILDELIDTPTHVTL